MKTSLYIHLLLFVSILLIPTLSHAQSMNLPTKTEVASIIFKANDYWQERNPVHGNSFWNRAAYHTGNMAAYAVTKDKRYYDFSYAWSVHNQWKGARSDIKENWKYSYGETNDYVLFGDFQICFQVYIDLFHIEPEEHKIARAREVMEYQMSTPNKDYWWWADGLYMVMPVMTRLYKITGNPLYLEKLFEYFSYADSIMYDPEVGLYYRDAKYVYPRHKTVNGLKDFWARGSGWVFAGFARVLEDLPLDDPYRPVYLQRFKAMAEALKTAQRPEGYWTRSILDPAHAPGPETSGTAFYTYGYLWGINNGIFSVEDYGPTVEKAWDYLANFALQPDGRVGYVQPIGENANPNQTVSATSTADFGVGAFLLAASEMIKMATGEMPAKLIRLTGLQVNDPNTITLEFSDLLDSESATNISSYLINGESVTDGEALYDGAFTVFLNLQSPLDYGPLTIVVNNVTGPDDAVIESNSSRTTYYNVPLTESDPSITVTAIGNQVGNPPHHTIDNSLNTRWSQPGLNQWIEYDLGAVNSVWAVDMAFFNGNQRQSYFDIELSVDGEQYETVLSGGVSSGLSTGLERFTFQAMPARYVRIVCNGNSTGGENWNSLTEVRIRFDDVTSINEKQAVDIGLEILSNPVRNNQLVFRVNNQESAMQTVRIFDAAGRLMHVSKHSIALDVVKIDNLNLSPGIYFLELSNLKGNQRIRFINM